MAKRLISIFFMGLFLLPFAGCYLYFAVRIKQIHTEMRQQLKTLPDHHFQQLVLTHSAYEDAQVEEDEIEVDGKMYDVARIQVSGDKVIVFCLHDEAEDNLLSFLQEVLKNASRDHQDVPSQVYQFITLSFVSPSAWVSTLVTTSTTVPSTLYLINDSSFIAILDSPPPRA